MDTSSKVIDQSAVKPKNEVEVAEEDDVVDDWENADIDQIASKIIAPTTGSTIR